MKIIKFILPLAILNLIALILVTYGLPSIVPIHIGLSGAINAFGSRWYIPIIGIIPVFISIIFIVYAYTRSDNLNIDVGDKIFSVVAIFLIVISWMPVCLALAFANYSGISSGNFSYNEMISFIGILLAILFLFFSHYMDKIKPNRMLGIRTPWTLKNEEVWKKTHDLGSYTFMIAGFVLIVYSLASYLSGNNSYFFIGIVLCLVLVAVIPSIYSYFEYRKLN